MGEVKGESKGVVVSEEDETGRSFRHDLPRPRKETNLPIRTRQFVKGVGSRKRRRLSQDMFP